MASPLRILHWNANGLTSQKTTLLRVVLSQQQVDVALINETHLKSGDRLRIPNFHIYRKDEISGTGTAYRGLLVAVRRRVLHQQIPTPDVQSIYALGVELCIERSPTRVFAVYKPPRTRLAVADVHKLLDSPHPTILGGDLNSKHRAWNSCINCVNGRRLFNDAEQRGYVVLGTEVPTHYPYVHTHTPDVIDLTVTSGLSTQPTVEVLDDHLMSDHQPVLVCLAERPAVAPPLAARRRYDWEAFEEYMERHTPTRPITTSVDVDQMAADLTSCIQSALEASSRSAICRRRTPEPIPGHIGTMIQEKRRLRRFWQRTRCPTIKTRLNSLAEKISDLLLASQTESWQRHIESTGEDMTSIHRLCRQLSGKPTPIRPLQAADGTPRYRAEDRAEIFADCLERQFRPNPGDDTQAAEVFEHVATYFATPIAPEEDPIVFSPGKVQRMIRRTHPRKAPGPDGITNEALRHLPSRSVAAVTRLYNGILRAGHFPSSWKMGRVIMLPKPGKNILKPESYRPITLLPTISKVFGNFCCNTWFHT